MRKRQAAKDSIEGPKRDRGSLALRYALVHSAALAVVATGACKPLVDIEGVYVPAWLFSATIGITLAYAIVWILADRPAWRELARSGLFYCSLALSLAMIAWWLLFSQF